MAAEQEVPVETYTGSQIEPEQVEPPYVPETAVSPTVDGPAVNPAQSSTPTPAQPDPAMITMQSNIDSILSILQGTKQEVKGLHAELLSHKAEVAAQLAGSSQVPIPQSAGSASTSPVHMPQLFAMQTGTPPSAPMAQTGNLAQPGPEPVDISAQSIIQTVVERNANLVTQLLATADAVGYMAKGYSSYQVLSWYQKNGYPTLQIPT